MTTRDPRSRSQPAPPVREGAREPTQSLQVEIDPLDDDYPDSRISHPSLALGTHEKRSAHTKVESPAGAQRGPQSRPPPPPRADTDDPDLRIGTQLGSYRVTQLLGKGGMGYVYRAEHVKLGREVALKLLRGDYARRRDAVARFIQEARTVNRIRHRNIVDVPDIIELDDGTTFIVMELLQGISLGKWARTGVDLPRALAVLVQICDGLAAAHAVGVIHRDLKPDNVIVVPTSDGAELVKLLDFGVAKLLNRDDEDVGFQTAAGSVIGTPAYMSPEQAGGMAVDARSDIYSLGAIMYELFCGQPMFRGRSFGEYVRKHLTEMPIQPRATAGGKDLDERIEALILKCLEKEPAQRFGHILELRDGLLAMLGGDAFSQSYGAVSYASAVRGPGGMGTGLGFPQLASSPPRVPTPAPLSTSSHYSVQVAPIPSVTGMQYTGMQYTVAPAAPKPMPWWIWVAGGAVAIALGIGMALWYAGHADAPAPVAHVTVPDPTPSTNPGPIAPKLISVHFDSLPAASVFADGHSAELCKTPCAFDIDLADGGPTDHRAFVVRTDGYVDKQVVVDLTVAHPELHVTLDRVAAAAIATPDPVTQPIAHPSSNPNPTHPTHPTRPAHPTAAEVKPEPGKPVETKPVKPHVDAIDQTETLDPFHSK